MKIIIQIIVPAVIGVGLNITNPSKNEFIDFAAGQVKENYPDLNFKTNSESSGIEKMIAGFGNMMITTVIAESIVTKDYFFFSIHELDMKLARNFGVDEKNIKVLGIAKHFVPL